MNEQLNEATAQIWSSVELHRVSEVFPLSAIELPAAEGVSEASVSGSERRYDALDIILAIAVDELCKFGMSMPVACKIASEAVGTIFKLVRKYKNVELNHLGKLFALRTIAVVRDGKHFCTVDEAQTTSFGVLVVDLGKIATHVAAELMSMLDEEDAE